MTDRDAAGPSVFVRLADKPYIKVRFGDAEDVSDLAKKALSALRGYSMLPYSPLILELRVVSLHVDDEPSELEELTATVSPRLKLCAPLPQPGAWLLATVSWSAG